MKEKCGYNYINEIEVLKNGEFIGYNRGYESGTVSILFVSSNSQSPKKTTTFFHPQNHLKSISEIFFFLRFVKKIERGEPLLKKKNPKFFFFNL